MAKVLYNSLHKQFPEAQEKDLLKVYTYKVDYISTHSVYLHYMYCESCCFQQFTFFLGGPTCYFYTLFLKVLFIVSVFSMCLFCKQYPCLV